MTCKRLKSKHTYAELAQTMYDVYLSFRIQNKIICTTTDNGSSNFEKVFQTYYIWPNIKDIELDQDDNELEFIDLTEIIEKGQPYRCVSRTSKLIATRDIDAYFVGKN